MKTVVEIQQLVGSVGSIRMVAKLLARLEDDDELSSIGYNLESAVEKLDGLAQQVKVIGERTYEKVHRAQEWRADFMPFGPFVCGVSSLGEMQGTAGAFDIACALYEQAFGKLNSTICRRARQEKEVARKAKRASYRGELGELLAALEHLVPQQRCTVKQLATRMGWDYTTTLTAVSVLADESEPFVVRVLNNKNEVKEVFYQDEVR